MCQISSVYDLSDEIIVKSIWQSLSKLIVRRRCIIVLFISWVDLFEHYQRKAYKHQLNVFKFELRKKLWQSRLFCIANQSK